MVRQRTALEPTGLLKLASAQIHERQWDQADTTLRKLSTQSWPVRFGNVANEVRVLQRQIDNERGSRGTNR